MVVTTAFRKPAREEAETLGVPDLPLIVLPHPVSHLDTNDLRAMAEASLSSVIACLTAREEALVLDYDVNYVLPHQRGEDQVADDCEACESYLSGD